MGGLKEAFEDVRRQIRCYTPLQLRKFAQVESSNGNHEMARKYERMAYAREWIWKEYCKKCLELDE